MNVVQQCAEAVADIGRLDQALDAADSVPMLLSLVHLTGQAQWLERARPHIAGGWSFQEAIPPELRSEIRQALRQTLIGVADGSLAAELPSRELLNEMMNTSVGQRVPEEYQPLFFEETQIDGADPKRVEWRRPVAAATLDDYSVVVIGAGFSGIGMAIKLAEAGIPYAVLEKNEEVGGTWFENFYPGAAVDTPNHFYSYSFAPNPDWTRYFASGPEIHRYIMGVVERFGIRSNIEFGIEVLSAEFDEDAAVWRLTTRSKSGVTQTRAANALISAVGALNKPSIPRIPGLETFAGPALHTARWDNDLELEGKRVALIGTGASAIQVAPQMASKVARLSIFQRSGHWVINHPLYTKPIDARVRWCMAHVPFYMKWFRFQLFWAASDGFHPTLKMDPDWTQPSLSLNAANHKLREELTDYYKSKVGHRPDLLAKVVPDYPPFGKRMLRDTGWFEMLLRPDVDLVTEHIDRIEPDAVVTKDGQRHEVDIIVLATGFEAARMLAPMNIVGREGVSLRDLWGDDDPRAYLGITVPRFPNFFMLYGPNTNLAHGGSAVFHSECQIRYVMQGLREMIETGASSMECLPAPFEQYNERVDEALSRMVWAHPGVTNWYKNKKGRVIMNSPWRLVDYRNMTAELDRADFEFREREL